MDDTSDYREDLQTAALLEHLQRMRESRCEDCGTPICSHETLMSIVAGAKDAPRCLSCLARVLGQGREELRDHLLAYIKIRTCRQTAWVWANDEEHMEAVELPLCLWPRSAEARQENKSAERSMMSNERADSNLAAHEWDAENLGCGELVMELRKRLQTLKPGEILKLTATDEGMPEDLPAWCRLTGHTLVHANHPEYWIRRREN